MSVGQCSIPQKLLGRFQIRRHKLHRHRRIVHRLHLRVARRVVVMRMRVHNDQWNTGPLVARQPVLYRPPKSRREIPISRSRVRSKALSLPKNRKINGFSKSVHGDCLSR